MQERIQRYGGEPAGMAIPNIGAILAWGLLTALFIPSAGRRTGTRALVGPMIRYLLPLLIAYTGGKLGPRPSGRGPRRGG